MSMIVVYMMNNNTYCLLLESKRVSELRVGVGVPENHTENFYTSASPTHKSLLIRTSWGKSVSHTKQGQTHNMKGHVHGRCPTP